MAQAALKHHDYAQDNRPEPAERRRVYIALVAEEACNLPANNNCDFEAFIERYHLNKTFA